MPFKSWTNLFFKSTDLKNIYYIIAIKTHILFGTFLNEFDIISLERNFFRVLLSQPICLRTQTYPDENSTFQTKKTKVLLQYKTSNKYWLVDSLLFIQRIVRVSGKLVFQIRFFIFLVYFLFNSKIYWPVIPTILSL
jgi:hypothetical protein